MLYSSFKDFIVCFLKPLNGLAPYNLSELLSWRSHQMLVFVHTSRLKPRLHLSFTNPPLQIRTSPALDIFKTSSKTRLYSLAFKYKQDFDTSLLFCLFFILFFSVFDVNPYFFINVPITPPPPHPIDCWEEEDIVKMLLHHKWLFESLHSDRSAWLARTQSNLMLQQTFQETKTFLGKGHPDICADVFNDYLMASFN